MIYIYSLCKRTNEKMLDKMSLFMMPTHVANKLEKKALSMRWHS